MNHSKLRTRVPALISGKNIIIDPNSISDWDKHSGAAYDGTQVSSLKSASVGDTTLLRAGNQVISAPTSEMQVFATQFLENLGAVITPPETAA